MVKAGIRVKRAGWVNLVCLVERNEPGEPHQPDQLNKPDGPDNGIPMLTRSLS
jgi:hypothetical protein